MVGEVPFHKGRFVEEGVGDFRVDVEEAGAFDFWGRHFWKVVWLGWGTGEGMW